MKNISFRNTDITDGFWKSKQDMVSNTTVHAVYNRFKDTHRFSALKCDWRQGDPNMPHIFWDSDVAKWIEGVSYLLEKGQRPELQAIVEEAIDNIIANADGNGYFNSHFLVTEQDMRFCKRDWHELYCAGHLIEAAVAYKRATGETRFLEAMCRYADYVERIFKIEKSAKFATPGHPELELALVKLWEETGEKRYLELAQYFINEHGKNIKGEKDSTFTGFGSDKYNQDDMLLKDRTTIDGHSVRALYLYSGAADVARLYGDSELLAACERIFENVVSKRMYVTGGVGSTHIGEAFTVDYDLPNRTAYTETCAAIALVYFASRMQLISPNSKYADCIERVLYNGFLSGVSMDGRSFFYENPLEIDLDFNDVNPATVHKERFPITQRKEVFDCSCCPPNVVRFIPSVADYTYNYDDSTLYVQQYMNARTECDGMSLEQITDYPASGNVRIRCVSGGRRIALRIPAWCQSFSLNKSYVMENGYAVISAEDGESIELCLDMPVVAVRANRRVHDNAGRVAITRGPVVYCAEGVDNGSDLKNVKVDIRGEFTVKASDLLLPTLHTTAYMPKESPELYRPAGDDWEPVPLTLIPYYAFANRGSSEMYVWLLEK